MCVNAPCAALMPVEVRIRQKILWKLAMSCHVGAGK